MTPSSKATVPIAPLGPELDVLVVGAGPTGLVMAAELTARGIRARIIDKSRARSDKSRALVVQARTMELFQKMGIADELQARGKGPLQGNLFIERRRVASLPISDIGADDTPYPNLLFVSQAETEGLLEAHLGRLGLSVERPVSLLGFDDAGTFVTARLGHEGAEEETVRARFIVGCDGAHSVVRKAARIRFEGSPYPQDFMLADIELEWENGYDDLFFFFSKKGLLVMFPLKGDHNYRLVASRRGHVSSDAGDPTAAEFEAITRELCPFPMRLRNPHWLARFHLHHRGADRYRAGCAFIAGDAAHIHSPAGGQGMNTGIQDAYNLAWKMALVVKGRARDDLLDSYHAERKPVGQMLLKTTDRMFSIVATPNPLLIAARNFLVPRLAPWILKTHARRLRAFRFISQLAIRYRKSPIVAEDLHEGSAAFRRGPRAGERAPDAPLVLAEDRSTTSLFARVRGLDHALLLFGGRDRDTRAPAEIEAEVKAAIAGYEGLVSLHLILGRPPAAAPPASPNVYIDTEGLAHTRYGFVEPGIVLLRPDGYIAFRAPGLGFAGVSGYLRRTFMRA
jgi:2-polyprenyl-6-methoxyphenol hydroxylase-like FAD-dependent oxidoreductase